MMGLALRNHALSLSLAAGSQMVPVVAGLTLASVENAEFAIAWLIATFVFLPPYLLATALFAHGANVATEEFRTSMERTIPAALMLSGLLCVGAWVLGEPVLLIFGGDYARHSWAILALLVPAGLWMVFKDHLVALWRSQRRFALATRLAGAALVMEVAGAMTGGIIGGARGLCVGWLIAMGVEMVLGVPWLRQAFGGLHWRRRCPRAAAPSPAGVGDPAVVGAVALVAGDRRGRGLDRHPRTTARRRHDPRSDVHRAAPSRARSVETCAADRGATRAEDRPQRPVRHRGPATSRSAATTTSASWSGWPRSAGAAGRSRPPRRSGPCSPTRGRADPVQRYIDRTIGAARSAGLAGPAPAGRHARLGARRPGSSPGSRRGPTPSCERWADVRRPR